MLISVIVPTFNRLKLLVRCVGALQAQTLPPADYELIVVDDGSRDGTRSWLEQQAGLRAVFVPRQGPAAARNAGVRCARGQSVAFTDDDCTATADWLESLAYTLQDHDVAGGRVINAVPANLLAETAQSIVDLLGEELNGDMRNGGMLTANNLAYRRNTFEAAGGFDERYTVGGEERDLNYRLWRQKARLAFSAQAIVRHHADPSLRRFLTQQFTYGHGARRFYRLSPPPARLPRAFYGRLFRSIGRDRPATVRAAMLAAMAASQCAVVFGYIWSDRPVIKKIDEDR
jgi:glycosyltransferase involved in cell wall biosynthesis